MHETRRRHADLVEAATKERGQRLKQVLSELAQRPGDEPLGALGIAAASYERDVQQYARNLLVQNLSRQTPTFVKEKLADDKAEVRLAAARVAVKRNLPIYLVVEKITASFEYLPPTWPVHGETGYHFANVVNRLLVDAVEPLERLADE